MTMYDLERRKRWSLILENVEGRWPQFAEVTTEIERGDWQHMLCQFQPDQVIEALRNVRARYSSARPELKWVMTELHAIRKTEREAGSKTTEEAEFNKWMNGLTPQQQDLAMLYVRIYAVLTPEQDRIVTSLFRAFGEVPDMNPLELQSDRVIENRHLPDLARALVAWVIERKRPPTMDEIERGRRWYSAEMAKRRNRTPIGAIEQTPAGATA